MYNKCFFSGIFFFTFESLRSKKNIHNKKKNIYHSFRSNFGLILCQFGKKNVISIFGPNSKFNCLRIISTYA